MEDITHVCTPTVCLNMIVKNEAHIIRQTLEMLCRKIRFARWVICDTGSTDATPQIITNFFETVGIPGELHFDKWVDFAHNRTLALRRAFNKTDLLLVFDADDELHGTIVMPTTVTYDEYDLKFGAADSGITYQRVLLINNRKKFRYFSVIHEYISCEEPSPCEQDRKQLLQGDYHVVSRRAGARSADPDTYLKDAQILERAHAEALSTGDMLYRRYAFYCANSYHDCGRHRQAITWYRIVLAQDNWVQEKFFSCVRIYECYKALGEPEAGFYYLVKGLAYDTERGECVYPLVVHHCCEGITQPIHMYIAYNYYKTIQSSYERAHLQQDSLAQKQFLSTEQNNFLLPYYMIIVADKVGDRSCGVSMYEIIFKQAQRFFVTWYVRNLLFNLRFFVPHVTDTVSFATRANQYFQFLRQNGVPLATFTEVAGTFDYEEYGIQLKPHVPVVSSATINVLFYTGYSETPWNFHSADQHALGGSEKAVAYLSNEFTRFLKDRRFAVYVAGDVMPYDGDNGAIYVHLSGLHRLLRNTRMHTIICSRYISFLELYGADTTFDQFYIWAHDTALLSHGCKLTDVQILQKWGHRINGCICQTRWHASEFLRMYPMLQNKIHNINNGINPVLFPSSVAKRPNKFIYTFRAERGLARLLELWPDVVSVLADATLVISSVVPFPSNEQERQMQHRIAALNKSLPFRSDDDCEIDRIQHLRQLNSGALYKEMSSSEYCLYPTNWSETSCITALELLMCGVICLHYPVAGLPETMNGCGVPMMAGKEIETLTTLVSNQACKESLRAAGRGYAETCSWARRSSDWLTHLNLPNIN